MGGQNWSVQVTTNNNVCTVMNEQLLSCCHFGQVSIKENKKNQNYKIILFVETATKFCYRIYVKQDQVDNAAIDYITKVHIKTHTNYL